MSWESNSSNTTSATDSTSDASCGSVTTGYISIPQTDSSIDDNLDNQDFRGKQEKPERLRQNYRGQLRIDINIIGNYISTHFFAARNIATKTKSKPDCFIEITIFPESRVHSKCISTVYYNSNRPVFDEKISMELPVDYKSKRLLITLYHIKFPSRQHEFLGCMSFGLHRARTEPQLASGWYYILDEEVGTRRHVKVIDNAVSVKNYLPNMNVSKVLLCRTEDCGFGLSVFGSRPVRICKVKTGSTAELHNLQEGDAILAIDVYDVSNMTSLEVASIIRGIKAFTSMAIQRGPHYECDKNEDRVKNGVVVKLIKKIFYSEQRINTAGSKPTSDKLVDYGWLEGDGRDEGCSNSEDVGRPHSNPSLRRTDDLRKGLRRRVSNSRDRPNSKDNNPERTPQRRLDVNGERRTFAQKLHSNTRRYENIEEEDNEDEEYHHETSDCGWQNKMLSPVAEGDSLLVSGDDDDHRGISEDSSLMNVSDAIRSDVTNGDSFHHPETSYVENYHEVSHGNDSRYTYDDDEYSRSMINDRLRDEHNNRYHDDEVSNASNNALRPEEINQNENSFSYSDNVHDDDDRKENMAPPCLRAVQSSRTNITPFQRNSYTQNRPLSSRENITPLSDNIFTGSMPRSFMKNNKFDEGVGAFTPTLNTPSAPARKGLKAALIPRLKTVFKNKHAF